MVFGFAEKELSTRNPQTDIGFTLIADGRYGKCRMRVRGLTTACQALSTSERIDHDSPLLPICFALKRSYRAYYGEHELLRSG